MREKKSHIISKRKEITLTTILILSLLSTPITGALPTKTDCQKPHCTRCLYNENCLSCEERWGAQGSDSCYRCPENCISCSSGTSCDTCIKDFKLKKGECEKGGTNALTVIVSIIIIIFVIMLIYVCYKQIKKKQSSSNGRVWSSNNVNKKSGNLEGNFHKVDNKSFNNNTNISFPMINNSEYQSVKVKPNNLDFVKQPQPNNMDFVKQVELDRQKEENMKKLEEMAKNKENNGNTGVNCKNGICNFDEEDANKKAVNLLFEDSNASTDKGGDVPVYLGNEFLRGSEIEKLASIELRRAEFIGLYFSASWCGPCRSFTTKLIENYEKVNKDGKKVEIVLITHDQGEQAFKDYFGKMPWLAIPFGSPKIQETKDKFTIKGIPKLVIMRRSVVLTEDGRSIFSQDDSKILKTLNVLKEEKVDARMENYVQSKKYPFLERYLLRGKTKESSNNLDKAEFVGFYMSASWCGPCRSFTPILKEFYEKINNRETKFEVVFCTNDRSGEEFQEYFSKMPWLAISFYSASLNRAWGAYPSKGIPKLTIVENKTMKVISEGGTADIRKFKDDPEACFRAWRGEKAPVKAPVKSSNNNNNNSNNESGLGYLGEEFIDNKGGKYNLNQIKSRKLLGLYFSASWCPPCRNFTSKLIPFYEDINKSEKKFEIVLIRGDNEENAFNDYFGKMPWKTLPFNATGPIGKAKTKFSVRGIPKMVILDDNGKVISENAVGEIMYSKDNKALIEKWRG